MAETRLPAGTLELRPRTEISIVTQNLFEKGIPLMSLGIRRIVLTIGMMVLAWAGGMGCGKTMPLAVLSRTTSPDGRLDAVVASDCNSTGTDGCSGECYVVLKGEKPEIAKDCGSGHFLSFGFQGPPSADGISLSWVGNDRLAVKAQYLHVFGYTNRSFPPGTDADVGVRLVLEEYKEK